MINNILRVARKELNTFFSSPLAFIFLGTFLAINLFVFFWMETFFARNIADVRPLFEWMPVLLVFLVSALTMKMWSEERRTGTLEFLTTLPVETPHLVLGKFAACLALVGIALSLTLPLPVTVSLLGNLDWGPVFGGYVATMFLSAAYISMGLYVSSKSDNQIISLIVSVLLCLGFYLIGSEMITSLLGNKPSEWLKLLGTGSRFSSITRGVIDFRDVYYYVSLVAIFVTLNIYSLDTLRWPKEAKKKSHRQWAVLTTLLLLNFLAANLWLKSVGWLRLDLTEGSSYSISKSTRKYLSQLKEPLLIRGYFSAKTHPYLSPLVPRLRDLLLEYEVAGDGRVKVEFIDPVEHPDLEQEAGQKYAIRPVPFQVSDRYQAALINSYFNILILYGDQYEVLGYDDLIDIKFGGEGKPEIELRNPEYDITRTIKKVLYSYQSEDDLFASVKKPITFKAYLSSDRLLPKSLGEFKKEMNSLLDEMKQDSRGKLEVQVLDPDENNGALAKEISKKYGLKPMQAGLLNPNLFYFYMILETEDQSMLIPLPRNLKEAELRRSLEAGVKRFSTGFMKTITMVMPPPNTAALAAQSMGGQVPPQQFNRLRQTVKQNHRVTNADLKDGQVSEETDLLFILAPDKMDEKQIFAMDQFLMKGGTLILLTSPYLASVGKQELSFNKHESGLKNWLNHYGIEIKEEMVLDSQNSPFPVPIQRRVGPFTVREMKMINYPYFVDVRGKGLSKDNSLTSGLSQLTMHWASPIVLDEEKNKDRKVTPILKSSPKSWTSDTTSVIPNTEADDALRLPPGQETKQYVLGLTVEGQFQSFYKDKPSPLLTEDPNKNEEIFTGVMEESPESSRIVLLASNEFLTDKVLRLAGSVQGTQYSNSLQLIENAIEWSLEDQTLLSIRGQNHFSRTLLPLTKGKRMFWETLNYGLALVGLLIVFLVYRFLRNRHQNRLRMILAQGEI